MTPDICLSRLHLKETEMARLSCIWIHWYPRGTL